jgi:hypothetical protein
MVAVVQRLGKVSSGMAEDENEIEKLEAGFPPFPVQRLPLPGKKSSDRDSQWLRPPMAPFTRPSQTARRHLVKRIDPPYYVGQKTFTIQRSAKIT